MCYKVEIFIFYDSCNLCHRDRWLAYLTFIFTLLINFRKPLLDPGQKSDLLKGLIFAVVSFLLTYIDTSVIYHLVRAQTLIKLYIIYNMLEVKEIWLIIHHSVYISKQLFPALLIFILGSWSIVFIFWSRYSRRFILDRDQPEKWKFQTFLSYNFGNILCLYPFEYLCAQNNCNVLV